MVSSDRIWHLIARALNDEASTPELQELAAYLQDHPSLQQQYELLDRIWNEPDTTADEADQAEQAVLGIINKANVEDEIARIDRAGRRRKRRNRIVAFAFSMLTIAGGWWIWDNANSAPSLVASERKMAVQEPLEAKNGSRIRSLLADGTTVWLNAGSRLTYESDFSGNTREVRLEGEAFFDVVKNPSKPFIVHTAGIDIKVLGTAFNVKSYPEEKTVETTLYRGAVKVFRQTETEKSAINLSPNQKLTIAKDAALEKERMSENITQISDVKGTSYSIAILDSTKKESEQFETAWLYSRLEFRGDNFEQLARKMERWYNVDIEFSDERVKRLNFNGSFEKETVEQALRYLHETIPSFTYKINNHDITIGSLR